jgi:hypothetical protein
MLVSVALTTPVCIELFGEHACNSAFLRTAAQPAFKMFLAQTHARRKRAWKRSFQTLFGKVDAQGIPEAESVALGPSFQKLMNGMGYFEFISFTYNLFVHRFGGKGRMGPSGRQDGP